jgi:phosphonate metabolism protein PhnN/1,5-bisphosphokinase (PRPP-forming)
MLQRPDNLTPGILVLVVGPSGAGKDALISAGREKLAADARFSFVTRITTRTGSNEGEVQDLVSPEQFALMRRDHQFLLSWPAHGIAYGIPITARNDLERGRIVVANASRTVIATAETIVSRLAVINVTAPVEVLAGRLARRGREPLDDVEARLLRAVELPLIKGPVLEICNDGLLQTAVDKFTAHLLAVADQLSG